jgi:uncharacterized membrane-anchored protein
MIVPNEHEELSKNQKIVYYSLTITIFIIFAVVVGSAVLVNIDNYNCVSAFAPTDIQLLFMMAPLIIMIIAASIMLIVFYLKKESPVTTELYPHGEDKNE